MPSRRSLAIGAAGLAGAAAIAVPLGLSQGGSIDVFVGGTPTPSATASSCTTTLSSGGNVSTALTNATAGARICLNAGTYTYNASVTKSSMTTVTAADGVDVGDVLFSTFTTNATQNVTFQNITLTNPSFIGSNDHNSATSSANVILKDSVVTDNLCITGRTNNGGIIVDGVDFGTGNGQPGGCGQEGRLTLNQGCSACGTIIRNSKFGPYGDSDGIQAGWGGKGYTIGPGNFFDRIQQDAHDGGSGCPNSHCDSIQIYGSGDVNVTGNYFYAVSDALQIGDCGSVGVRGTPANFTNNVVHADPVSQTPTVDISEAMTGMVVTHNTLSSASSFILEDGNQNCNNAPITIRNNIFQGGCEFRNMTGANTIDHNLVPSSGSVCNGGTGAIVGSPTYTGGSTPSTFAGWALSGASLGLLGASDGTNIGAPVASMTGAW